VRLGDHAVLDRITALEILSRQVDAVRLATLGEAENRSLATNLGFRSLVELQYTHLNISRAEAKRRAVRIRAVRSDSYPSAVEAMQSGEISTEHLDELIRFHDSLSDTLAPAEWNESEPSLTDAARAVDPPHCADSSMPRQGDGFAT
jgi:hypothetical protein